VRSMGKKRMDKDVNKVEELRAARTELTLAFKAFEHLLVLGQETTGVDSKKVAAHKEFCGQKVSVRTTTLIINRVAANCISDHILQVYVRSFNAV
jgi:hypothetical protein